MGVKVIQLFEKETSTYTYIVFDKASKEALIIDPVDVCFSRDMDLVQKLNIHLKYSLETHIHADHISGAYLLRDKLNVKAGVSEKSGSLCADVLLKDRQVLKLGDIDVTCLSTPGHTNTCMSFLIEGYLFTGDTLMINGCGRTDFQEGSNKNLFDSVREKLFSLPDDTVVYPGHDYKGYTTSSIGFEKEFNPRLKEENSFEAFGI